MSVVTAPAGDREPDAGTGGPRQRNRERRRAIFAALHDSVIACGYNRATLSDIAARANMSPSHLLYYFKGKDDILEQYFAGVADRLLEQLEKHRHEEPKRRIDHVADIWFRSRAAALTEIGFMLECFGAAVHDERLRQTKTAFDMRCKAYLADMFAEAATPEHSSEDAAEVVYALMIGLRSAVYFDDTLALETAQRIFTDTARRLAGIPAG